MGWFRKLAGVSKRQKKKNEDIRLDLNQLETLVQKIPDYTNYNANYNGSGKADE